MLYTHLSMKISTLMLKKWGRTDGTDTKARKYKKITD